MRALLCFLTLITTYCLGSDKQLKEFDYGPRRFKISIPADWKEIPRLELDELSKRLASLQPKAPRQEYSKGFQLEANKDWFVYPYILIQEKPYRTGDSELRNMKKIQTETTKQLNEYNKEGEVFQNLNIGEMAYDEGQKIVWMKASADVSNIGSIETLAGMRLTEKATIVVTCACLKDEMHMYQETFKSIVNSVKVDPADEYVSDESKRDYKLGEAIGRVVGIFIGLFIVWYLYKKGVLKLG